MASLIRRQEHPVNVDYNAWALQELDDTQVPVLFPEGFESGRFLSAHPGRLDLYSAGHTHTASLTVDGQHHLFFGQVARQGDGGRTDARGDRIVGRAGRLAGASGVHRP
ncbi:hypothetical protein ABT373_20780 [Streptomyces sp. NPDC000070]|uniref:hypothetical protein n=1 Tax=Streptomyces sp. NPDC000070 TaxID=3154240 RepID=UPI00332CA756